MKRIIMVLISCITLSVLTPIPGRGYSVAYAYEKVTEPGKLEASKKGKKALSKTERYEKELKKAVSGINKKWRPEQKAMYIHDYIIQHVTYAWDKLGNPNFAEGYAYDALIGHRTICNGYADLFFDMANKAGLKTEFVASTKLDHAWNAVRINGKWYYVDCTWDDGGSVPSYPGVHYKNFLCSESAFRKNSHKYNDWGGYKDTKYDKAPWKRTGYRGTAYLSDGIVYLDQYTKTLYHYNFAGSPKELAKNPDFSSYSIAQKGNKVFIGGKECIYCYDTNAKKLFPIYEMTEQEKTLGDSGEIELHLIGNVLWYRIGSYWRALDISTVTQIQPKRFYLDEYKHVFDKAGDSFVLTVTPDNIDGLSFSSDNESVATVDQNGLVTAKGSGACVITVSTGSYSLLCVIKVNSTTEAAEETVPEGTSDTTWQNDYSFVLGEDSMFHSDRELYSHDLLIEAYIGTSKDIVVPAKAIIGGKVYRTRVRGLVTDNASVKKVEQDGYNTKTSYETVKTVAEHVRFEPGVEFTKGAIIADSSSNIKSIDLQGLYTGDVEDFKIAKDCNSLTTVSMRGIDLEKYCIHGTGAIMSNCPSLETIIMPALYRDSEDFCVETIYNERLKFIDYSSGEISDRLASFLANAEIHRYRNKNSDDSGKEFKQKSVVYYVTKAYGKTAAPTVKVKKISGQKVTIPATVKYNGHTYYVTAIDSGANKNNKALKSLTINNPYITKLGGFKESKKLEQVTLNCQSLSIIEEKAFYKCTKLKTIKVKSDYPSLEEIGANAFKGINDKAKIYVKKTTEIDWWTLLIRSEFPNKNNVKVMK